VLSEVYLKSSERPIDQSILFWATKISNDRILHCKKMVDEQVTINSGKAF